MRLFVFDKPVMEGVYVLRELTEADPKGKVSTQNIQRNVLLL